MDATIQHTFRPTTNNLHKSHLLLQHTQHYPLLSQWRPVIQTCLLPKPSHLLLLVTGQTALKSYGAIASCPFWKFFLRTNTFTVKMHLWGFTEGSWKGSARGKRQLHSIACAVCTITLLETASACKARYFLSPTSLFRKMDFTGIC